MKRKIFLTIAFIISLIPMLANQYGGVRGVREISGLSNLWNPIGIIAVILFLIALWAPIKNIKIAKIIGIIGLIGVIAAEIYTFLTWPLPAYQDSINLAFSFENAFPEFYLGLVTSALMVVTYVCIMTMPENKSGAVRASNAKRSTGKKKSRR